MILPGRGIYVITDGPREDLLDAVSASIAGGARVVQYRDKTGDTQRRLAESRGLATLCMSAGIPLIINDDVDLAAHSGASGVHLGKNDCDIRDARERLGNDAIIGVSCYGSIDRARRLAFEGADYLAFGAFHASPTKPDAPRATLDVLRQARALELPLVAIGGITADNARPLIEAGADFVAVISAVFAEEDIESATRRITALFS